MGRYMRKCKRLREAAREEKTKEIGVRMTRALKARQTEGRRKRTGLGGSESEMAASAERRKTRLFDVVPPENSALQENSGNSTCGSASSDHVLASCCSSNGSSELAKSSTNFVDLEEENVDFWKPSASDFVDSSERRSRTVQADSGELESTAMPREFNFRGTSMAEKMPSEAELEEFFSAAEKNLQKQFIDKYNYDIAKDEPMEGRYEWVRIPPPPVKP